MSLRIFHICFISISIILCLGFGLWAIRQTGPYTTIVGVLSFAAGIALFVYTNRFLKKMQNL